MPRLTNEQAIEVARNAVKDCVTLQAGSPIRVEAHEKQIIVTFVHILPPGTRGPDYDAKVTIDAKSAAVLQLLVGS